jgi:hypothetical protein
MSPEFRTLLRRTNDCHWSKRIIVLLEPILACYNFTWLRHWNNPMKKDLSFRSSLIEQLVNSSRPYNSEASAVHYWATFFLWAIITEGFSLIIVQCIHYSAACCDADSAKGFTHVQSMDSPQNLNEMCVHIMHRQKTQFTVHGSRLTGLSKNRFEFEYISHHDSRYEVLYSL